MLQKIDFQERSNEVFCTLLLNGNEWTARTSSTVGIEEYFPARKETSNGRRDTREILTVPNLQF